MFDLSAGITLAAGDNAALVTFVLYTLAVFALAALSSRLLKGQNFLNEYFLGSRSLGVWALALTFAATSASGGTFTGFPSLIYMHGWVLALWISSYMVFPICTMGLLGKRINQVARKTGAITVPDILRDRFSSAALSLLATSMIVFFICINLVGQFKAGSIILETLLGENEIYLSCVNSVAGVIVSVPALNGVEPGYLLCLIMFGFSVILYTTWGGFHAVVWTDVMQGIVMVAGVVIMLPMAIFQAGGMHNATDQLAHMIPPNTAEIRLTTSDAAITIPRGTWLRTNDSPSRVFRTATTASVNDTPGNAIRAIEIMDAGDLQRVVSGRTAVRFLDNVSVAEVTMSNPPAYPGKSVPGTYVTAPGPHFDNAAGMLPMSLAFSMFFYWAISGAGQPSNMVRLMAFRDTRTLRMSIITVAVYFSFIYFPLVVIFCCSRLLLPGMEVESDRVMPQMAVTLTRNIGAGWLAGFLIAAPFAAVMSTVDSFLLMISSSVVRDVYQRNINPRASQKTLQRLSYVCTVGVGVGVVVAAMNPPQFLQYIIVYVGSGLAACFLAPISLALYWKRTTTAGAFCSMLGGFLSHLALYIDGWYRGEGFTNPWRPFSLDPVVVGILVSYAAGFLVSLMTPKPSADVIRRYFYTEQKRS